MSERSPVDRSGSRPAPLLVPAPRRADFSSRFRPVPDGLARALAGVRADDAVPPGAFFPGVVLAEDGSIPPQGYRLEVDPDRIVLAFSDPAGRWNGILTLRQLVEPPGGELAGSRTIARGVIEDAPDFPVRAVHLDISRDRVPRTGMLQRLADRMAALKYNRIQLYIEHTFAYPGHEEVWRNASPLTAAELEAFDRYCAGRGMELVVIQNSFGHLERWLAHPRYRHLAECPDGFTDPWGVVRPVGSCLSPAVPGSVDFLARLYDELLPHVRSRWLAVGGDEPWELGQGRSRELCERRGKGRVYLDFLLTIHRLLGERGHRMLFYGDIITGYPDLVPEIPDDAAVLQWGYEADHPFERECPLYARSGKEFHVLAGTSSWNSIGGRWANARENILRAADNGLKNGAAGFGVADWGDNGHWQQQPVSWPAYVYGAAVSWCLETNRNLDVAEAVAAAWPTDPAAARAIVELGDACLLEPVRLHNASLLGALLLDPVYPYYRDRFASVRGWAVEAERERVAEARGRLAGVHAEPEGEEIRFTADLMDFGLRYAGELLRAGSLAEPGSPAGPGTPPAARGTAFASDLDDLIERYRHLWLIRSRPGGLPDSVSRFAALRRRLAEG